MSLIQLPNDVRNRDGILTEHTLGKSLCRALSIVSLIALHFTPSAVAAISDEEKMVLTFLDRGDAQGAAVFLVNTMKALPPNLNDPEKVVGFGQMLKFVCEDLLTDQAHLAFREQYIYPVKTERDQALRFLFYTQSIKGASIAEYAEAVSAYNWVLNGSDDVAKAACLGFAVGLYADMGNVAQAVITLNQFAELDTPGNITLELVADVGGKMAKEPTQLLSFLEHEAFSNKMKKVLATGPIPLMLRAYGEQRKAGGEHGGYSFLARRVLDEEDWRTRYACVSLMHDNLADGTVTTCLYTLADRKVLTPDVIRARMLLINDAVRSRSISAKFMEWAVQLCNETRAVFHVSERKLEPEIIHGIENFAGFLALEGQYESAKTLYVSLRDRYPASKLFTRMEENLRRTERMEHEAVSK